MGSDAAEFVDKVKDQVRNRQNRMSNVAESGEEHSIIWGMFMVATMNAATFMGKNYVDIPNYIMNSRESSMQYWNLLLAPPLAVKHTFRRSSDQPIDCGNLF